MDESNPNRNMPTFVYGNLERWRRVIHSQFLSLQPRHLLHSTPNSLKLFRIKHRHKGHSKPFSFYLSHGSKSNSNKSFVGRLWHAQACKSISKIEKSAMISHEIWLIYIRFREILLELCCIVCRITLKLIYVVHFIESHDLSICAY